MKNKWDESCAKEEFVYGVNPNLFIEAEAKRFKSKSNIACLAEGEGRNAVYLARQGDDVTAYDISNVGLDKASRLAESNGVCSQTKQMDLINDGLPENTYDHAVLVFGHVHKDNQTTLINSLINTVKKGGLFMFEVYSNAQLNYNTGVHGNLDYLYDTITIFVIIVLSVFFLFYFYVAV